MKLKVSVISSCFAVCDTQFLCQACAPQCSRIQVSYAVGRSRVNLLDKDIIVFLLALVGNDLFDCVCRRLGTKCFDLLACLHSLRGYSAYWLVKVKVAYSQSDSFATT